MLGKFVQLNREACEKFAAKFPDFCKTRKQHRGALIERLLKACDSIPAKKLLDAGAINRPVLPKDPRYTLTGLDIEYKEDCEGIYDNFIVQSIEEPLLEHQDLIYSHALLEHVPNNKNTFMTIYDCLNPEGETHHYVPCKGHPYALILRLMGNDTQRMLINKLRPWVKPGTTGYPTFFSYCTPRQMRKLLDEIGFSEVTVEPHYRANYYFKFFFPLYLLITAFENLCRSLNWNYFSSGMQIAARK